MTVRPEGSPGSLWPDALLLDEMFSARLALRLVELGVNCRSVFDDPTLHLLGDESLAEAALEQIRVLVTDNAADFEILRRRREAEGLLMPKLIYVTDDLYPRNRDFIDAMAEGLERAARQRRASRCGGVYWLGWRREPGRASRAENSH